MPRNSAIQLTIEHQEGRNVIRAVLRAATVGPVRASALALSTPWREQVCHWSVLHAGPGGSQGLKRCVHRCLLSLRQLLWRPARVRPP